MAILSPDELLERLSDCEHRLSATHKILRDLQINKTIREEKAKIVVYSGKTELITNEKLRANLEIMKIQKVRITKEIAEGAVYIEAKEVMEPYMAAHEEAKRIKDEIDVLKTMLMEHQSRRKFKGIELEHLGEST